MIGQTPLTVLNAILLVGLLFIIGCAPDVFLSDLYWLWRKVLGRTDD